MSRWFVGSSRHSRLAGSASSLASARRVCSPPDRTPTFLSTASPLKRKAPSSLADLGGGHHRCGVVQLGEHGVRRVERLDLVLREVRDPHVAAQLARARIRLEGAGQHLQQGRLAGSVRTDERHRLAALEGQVEVAVVDDRLAVSLRDVGEADDGAPAALRLREAELHGLDLRRAHLDTVHLVELLDPALDLSRLRLLVAESLDEALQLSDLAALDAGLALEIGDSLVALFDEVGVVADVLGRESVVQLDDPVGDLVDEVAVVADQHDRPGVLRQELREPLDRREVEMVGRLVEQQHVGVLEQEPGEGHAHHPATAERADVAVHVAVSEAEAGQDAPRLRLEAVAAERLEPMLEPAVLVHQLGELVVVGRLLELLLDVAHAPLDAAHLAGAGEHVGERRPPAALGDLLAQVADDRVPGSRDRSAVGGLVAGDQLEQRRLAGAVRSDDREAPPGADHQADVAEQVLRRVALRHAGQGHEAHGRPAWYRRDGLSTRGSTSQALCKRPTQ